MRIISRGRTRGFIQYAAFIFLLLFSLILAFGRGYAYAVTEGLKLWIACVLPALFPYFFITAVLASLNVTGKIGSLLSPVTTRLFNCGGITGYAFFMSVISGYPVGAKLISDFRNENLISPAESVRAAAFCSTSSPMFLIGSVGNIMFKSSLFGFLLFITNILSAVLTGILFSFYRRKEKPVAKTVSLPVKTDNVLYDGVYSAVISVSVVGGLITLFYLFTEILFSIGIMPPVIGGLEKLTGSRAVAESLCCGLLECTRGLQALSSQPLSPFSLPVAAAICGFGGLSIIMQSVAYLKKAKIKTAPFFLAKILTAVFGFGLGTSLSFIFLF